MSVILFFLVLIPIIILYILLITKIVAGRWFTENGGYIQASAIIKETIAIDDGDGYKTIVPRTAFNYISIPDDKRYTVLDLSDKYLTRGMVLVFANASSVDVSVYIDGESIGETVPAGNSSSYIVSGPKTVRKV